MKSEITAGPNTANQQTLITPLTRAALALTVLAASACVRTAASATSDADSTAVPVIAHPVALSTHPWSTTASGIVHANTTVDVAFEVPGRVATAGPDEGQPVSAGQTIASLDQIGRASCRERV